MPLLRRRPCQGSRAGASGRPRASCSRAHPGGLQSARQRRSRAHRDPLVNDTPNPRPVSVGNSLTGFDWLITNLPYPPPSGSCCPVPAKQDAASPHWPAASGRPLRLGAASLHAASSLRWRKPYDAPSTLEPKRKSLSPRHYFSWFAPGQQPRPQGSTHGSSSRPDRQAPGIPSAPIILHSRSDGMSNEEMNKGREQPQHDRAGPRLHHREDHDGPGPPTEESIHQTRNRP